MADTVQYLLEESIPELEDYASKGYFTRGELKQIIMKRQDHEYRLKRRAALKQDYYRYIEYETKLEELRLFRKKKLGINGKKSISDTAIIKRIHFIYERAARKFKSDVQLWMDWLQYCRKSKSSKQHSKVVTRALQRHATTPVLWIEAATWEFEHSGNVAAARSLMQQGLRMCKHEEVMWVEYLRMELLYIHRLRERRRVMGLDVPGSGGEVVQPEQTEVAEATVAAAAADGAVAAAAAAGPVDESEAAVKAVLTGAVARIVLKNAVATIPCSLRLRQSVLDVLASFRFPGIDVLTERMYQAIAADFPKEEGAWELLARRPLTAAARRQARALSGEAPATVEGEASGRDMGRAAAEDEACHSAVVRVYEQAVHGLPSNRMYDLYASYLESRLQLLLKNAADAAMGEPASTSGRDDAALVGTPQQRKRGRAAGKPVDGEQQGVDGAAAAGAALLSLYGAAHAARCASSDLYLHWVRWALELGQDKIAGAAARQACGRHPGQVELWACRLRLEAGQVEQRRLKVPELLVTLQAAVTAVSSGSVVELWMLVLEAVPLGSVEFRQLLDLLVVTVTKSTSGPASGGLGRVVATILRRIRELQGLEPARTFYQRFLHLPAPGGEFFQAAIEIESSDEADASSSGAAAGGSKDRVKALFESAVASYGSGSPELWVQFAQYEAGRGRSSGAIYWRAMKAVEDPDGFATLFREKLQA